MTKRNTVPTSMAACRENIFLTKKNNQKTIPSKLEPKSIVTSKALSENLAPGGKYSSFYSNCTDIFMSKFQN